MNVDGCVPGVRGCAVYPRLRDPTPSAYKQSIARLLAACSLLAGPDRVLQNIGRVEVHEHAHKPKAHNTGPPAAAHSPTPRDPDENERTTSAMATRNSPAATTTVTATSLMIPSCHR